MIPAASPDEAEAELNRFLTSNRTTLIQRELIADGRHSFWSVVVEHGSAPGWLFSTRIFYKKGIFEAAPVGWAKAATGFQSASASVRYCPPVGRQDLYGQDS